MRRSREFAQATVLSLAAWLVTPLALLATTPLALLATTPLALLDTTPLALLDTTPLALLDTTPLALLAAPGPAAGTSARAASLECTRRLTAELRRSGRAEVTLSWSIEGTPGAGAGRRSGTLALEPPSLARLDVAATGDRVTLRGDGGEWLQPGLRQLIKLSPQHAGAAMRWWRLLASGEGAREKKLGRQGYRLVVSERGAEADSAEVWLDARGLPARLVLNDGAGGRQEYTLRGWRFTRARGAAAFRLAAPPGIEVVELP